MKKLGLDASVVTKGCQSCAKGAGYDTSMCSFVQQGLQAAGGRRLGSVTKQMCPIVVNAMKGVANSKAQLDTKYPKMSSCLWNMVNSTCKSAANKLPIRRRLSISSLWNKAKHALGNLDPIGKMKKLGLDASVVTKGCQSC